MTSDPFYITLASALAIHLGENILDAVSRRVRDKFSGGTQKEALTAALQEGLENSLAAFHLEEVDQDHFSSLFEKFLFEQSVIDELTHLIDPRANTSLDLALLKKEFDHAGFDENTLSYFNFDTFIVQFGEEFYTAAAKQSELRGAIEIGLLRTSIDQLINISTYAERTALAAEHNAATTNEISTILEKMLHGQAKMVDFAPTIEQAIKRGFEPSYELQEKIFSTLYKQGFEITVSDGNVVIGSNNQVENNISAQEIGEFQAEISRLRQVVDEQKSKEENLAVIETRYRQHLIRWFERLTFQGMMRTAQAISLPLEDVYVELRAIGEVPEAADTFSVEERRLLLEIDDEDEKAKQELMHHMDTLRRERWSRTSIERKSITEALFEQNQRAFVILGDPGSGKSTLLHLLALVYARGAETIKKYLKAPEQELDRVPIFLPLAAFDDMLRTQKGMTLLEFLPIYFDRRRMVTGLGPLFKRALESGKALVLFDGLDEVIDSTTRNYVANQVTALINEYTPRGVRFVMTSRFVGYREAPVGGDIPHLSVLDFGKEEIKAFIHQWAHTYETFAGGGKETPETIRLAHQLEKNLLQDVNSIPSVRRLAANPLMLTMLALLRRQVGPLPHRRIELYKRYMDTIIENWVEARSHGEREQVIRLVDSHHAESLLIPMAYWLQSTQPSGTASRADIEKALTNICLQDEGIDPSSAQRAQIKSAEERSQKFLSEMRNMSGLIVERGYDAFGFLHLTFQEYFAGRALAKMNPETRWKDVQLHLHNPRWREPILLCAGQLGVVEKRRDVVSEFVGKILACNDPTENDLHRNLLLALSIACDDVNLEHSLLNELVEKAISCMRTNVYVLASEIFKRLGQFIVNGVPNAEMCLYLIANSKDIQLQKTMTKALEDYIENPSIRQTMVQTVLHRLNNQDWYVRYSVLNEFAALVASDPDVRQAILQRLDDEDSNVRSSAARALTNLVASDPEVRQAILQRLDHQDYDVQISVVGALATLVASDAEVRQAILQRLDDHAYSVQNSAVNALATLVASDAEVRQAILQRLDYQDSSVQIYAIKALATLVASDAEVRQAILQRLDDHASSVQRSVVSALATLVASDAEVRQTILQRLDHQDSGVRSSAVNALATLVASDAEVRQAILQRLDDHASSVQRSAVSALATLVASDAEVRQAIVKQLNRLDWNVRLETVNTIAQALKDPKLINSLIPLIAAAEQFLPAPQSYEFIAKSIIALSGLVASDAEVRQVILQFLDDHNLSIRSSAIEALTTLVASDAEVRQTILQRLDDQDAIVQSSAIEALTTLVASDAEVRQAILQRLNNQVWWVQIYAIKALATLVASDAEVRQAILQRLDDQNLNVQISAVNALATLVASDAEVRQAILQRLDGQNVSVRSSAVSALATLVASDAEVRQAILQRLDDEDSNVRSSAARALTNLVASDAEVRQVILQRLDDQDSDVQSSVVGALATLVASDAEVRQAILQRLDDQDAIVQSSVVGALATLVASDAEVRQAILQRLDDQDAIVQSSAIKALTTLVASDAEVRQAILQRLDDQNVSVRMSAFISLTKLEKLDILEKDNRQRLMEWLMSNFDERYTPFADREEFESAEERLSILFASRLSSDQSLLNTMLEWLQSPRWPTRLGAVRTLLQWPGNPPKGILQKILESLNDNRGLESYPARLTAASYLINRDTYSKEAIQLGMEALNYGNSPWEYFPSESGAIRKQAALLLGTLEPVRYDQAIYNKLLHAMKTDQDSSVRDAVYGVLVKLAGIQDASR